MPAAAVPRLVGCVHVGKENWLPEQRVDSVGRARRRNCGLGLLDPRLATALLPVGPASASESPSTDAAKSVKGMVCVSERARESARMRVRACVIELVAPGCMDWLAAWGTRSGAKRSDGEGDGGLFSPKKKRHTL